jgi:hypothetical protein
MKSRLLVALVASYLLSVLFSACSKDSTMQPEDGGSMRVELNAEWIQRLPEIDFVWGSTNPIRDGWPEIGQEVTWRAHVRNWSEQEVTSVAYTWLLNGEEVSSGTVDIPAFSGTTVDYPWNWTFDRNELEFVLEPPQGILDQTTNNRLLIYTDALTIGFYLEKGFYDSFEYRWVDWVQGEVRRWNGMLESAIYPETPNGVFDRVRIDKIVVVPDGTIETDACPDKNDLAVDMQWGFSTDAIDSYTDIVRNPQILNSLLHELGHARYLIDVYGFDVFHGFRGDSIAIQENDQLIVGTEYLPSLGQIIGGGTTGERIYETHLTGLMSTISDEDHGHMGRYSAAAMNLIAGQRAAFGNFNEPENIGVFMNDLPAENRLTLKDAAGQLLADADVTIYQSQPNGFLYGKFFDDMPDLSFTADENGRVLLGRNPFDNAGPIVHDGLIGSNTVVIIRVAHDGKVGALRFLNQLRSTLLIGDERPSWRTTKSRLT